MAAGTPWPDAMMAALERRHPDYVVIFPSWFPTLARDPRFRAVYTLHDPGQHHDGRQRDRGLCDAVDAGAGKDLIHGDRLVDPGRPAPPARLEKATLR